MPFQEQPQRRLQDSLAEDDEEDDEIDGQEFDTFTVRIVKPMNYELTEELIQKFIDQGSLRIEDGREDALGPIYIKDFELQDTPAAHAFDAAEMLLQHQRLEGGAAGTAVGGAEGPLGHLGNFAALAAAAAAVLGAGALLSMRLASTSPAYATVEDAGVVRKPQQQQQPQVLNYSGYNPVAAWGTP